MGIPPKPVVELGDISRLSKPVIIDILHQFPLPAPYLNGQTTFFPAHSRNSRSCFTSLIFTCNALLASPQKRNFCFLPWKAYFFYYIRCVPHVLTTHPYPYNLLQRHIASPQFAFNERYAFSLYNSNTRMRKINQF